MRQRLISAAVLVPVVVIVFLLGDPWLTLGVAILAGIGAFEAARLLRLTDLPADAWLAMLAAPIAVIGLRYGADLSPQQVGSLVAGLMALVIIVAAIAAFRVSDPGTGFRVWAGTIMAALYPALLAFVVGILAVAPALPAGAPLAGTLDAGRLWLLVLVLTVWSFDSLAYVSGRFIGRGRFMNHISPNKTWSGVIGGSIAAIIVCAVLGWAVGQNPLAGAVLGLAIAVTAQSGDLAESLMKRAAGVKDSGSLIPGHGGILDRVDSFLFAAPVVFIALTWTQLVIQP
jgi:phosphatidate cytidylyltransferase